MSDKSQTNDQTLVSLSDADLLDAWIRDRQQTAFATLVHRYSVMVLSVCRRRCRSVADADDAYQTTFLYLARNASKIRRPECLPGWLHRVAQRASVATLSSKEQDNTPVVELTAKPDDPLDRLTQRHEAIVLDEELSALPEHYRSALVMHVFHEEPLAELAERFGTTVGSIRGRLQRGKRLLAQRLRKRGIVPVLAIAAANAWTVSSAMATEASGSMVDTTTSGDIPDPPIDSSALDPLLTNGNFVMSTSFGVASLLGGVAVVLMMCFGIQEQVDRSSPSSGVEVQPHVLALPAIPPKTDQQGQPSVIGSDGLLAQFGTGGIAGSGGEKSSQKTANGNKGRSKKQRNKKKSNSGGANNVAQNGSPPGSGLGFQPTVQVIQSVPYKATSAIALRAKELLDSEIEFSVDCKASDLAADLSKLLDVPVILNQRAMEFAKVDSETAKFVHPAINIPVRTGLRMLLRPHGLKASIEDEGIVVTADYATLVRRDIGVSHWINIDDELEKSMSETLQKKGDFAFVDTPLTEFADAMSELYGLPIQLDLRALEEIGLTNDVPVNGDLPSVSLQSALQTILRQLDLTFTVRDETLLITTAENDEQQLLNRIYWLESTGFANGDFDSVMDLIQTSFSPDSWEALGGTSTMNPIASGRPALLISTTYTTHKQIERFLRTIRSSHFGPDPSAELIERPVQAIGGSGGGGFGGGGLGGGGGGGGFF